jgi:SAM-dependent methyltransferase
MGERKGGPSDPSRPRSHRYGFRIGGAEILCNDHSGRHGVSKGSPRIQGCLVGDGIPGTFTGASEGRGPRIPTEHDQRGIYADRTYLDVVYASDLKPPTDYPNLLARRLTELYFERPGRLLELGCGRGDALRAFASLGYDVVGVDLSPKAPELAPGLDVRVADLETDPLPVEPETFEYVFTKSVVEHSFHPIEILRCGLAALEPGGKIVVMTPSWLHTGKRTFYGGVGHVTPFTTVSMRRTLAVAGFTGVRASFFYQLPFLWRFPFLLPLVRCLGLLHLPYRPFYERAPWPESLNKLIRFSTEVMLVGYGEKPKPSTSA